jgi:hypothetical protein
VREGETHAASKISTNKTPETFIVGVGASGILLAGAAIVFVTLVGLASFNVWPVGQGARSAPGTNVELATPKAAPSPLKPLQLQPGGRLIVVKPALPARAGSVPSGSAGHPHRGGGGRGGGGGHAHTPGGGRNATPIAPTTTPPASPAPTASAPSSPSTGNGMGTGGGGGNGNGNGHGQDHGSNSGGTNTGTGSTSSGSGSTTGQGHGGSHPSHPSHTAHSDQNVPIMHPSVPTQTVGHGHGQEPKH